MSPPTQRGNGCTSTDARPITDVAKTHGGTGSRSPMARIPDATGQGVEARPVGFGRELGPWGIEEYLETKQVHINLNEQPIGWY